MISSVHRFHGYNTISHVYRKGRTVRGNFCAIKFMPNGREGYRAAVVVSKKVSKSAVVRNRIRRRIYEIVRSLESRMVTPHDMVITVFHEQVARVPHEQLVESIEQQLIEASVVR